jgi:hypothetical protein
MQKMTGKKPLAVIIVALVFGSAVAVSFIGVYDSPFYWGLEVGDEFLYSIEVSLSETNIYYGTSQEYYTSLNATQIIVQITDLPNITGWISHQSFLPNVVLSEKITCRFSNGSAIPLIFMDSLTVPLSQSLLPLGDWNMIDNFYHDQFPNYTHPEVDSARTLTHYASTLLEDRIYFGSRELLSIFPNVATYTWEGWSDLETGIPLLAIYDMKYPSCMYSIYLTVTLAFQGIL